MPMTYTDRDRRDFLKKLDEADVNVTDFEAKFISSNLLTDQFSPKQREVINQMMTRYGQRIGW